MIEPIPVDQERIFGFRLSGEISHDEMRQFLQDLDGLIRENGRIALLLELRELTHVDPDALMEDARFGLDHPQGFARIAIVGEAAWQRWLSLLLAPFVSAPMRYFPQDALQDAWDWLEQAFAPRVTEAPEFDGYRHLLVAMDFSGNAMLALERALHLADHWQARISLVHVVEEPLFLYESLGDPVLPPPPPDLEEQMLAAAERRMDELRKKHLDRIENYQVLVGPVAERILYWAEAREVDLILTGAHRHGRLEALLGSISRALVRDAHCDVLAVRAAGAHYRHLVCPVDFGETSLVAAGRAAALAKWCRARLTLLHVIDYFPEDIPMEWIAPEDRDPEDWLRERARESLDKLRVPLPTENVEREVVSTEYSAGQEIVRSADRLHADLLVLPRRARKGLFHRIGYTTSTVLNRASCDVLVCIRDTEEAD